jgi:hypothetical protein
MYARNVAMNLKPNAGDQFTQMIEGDIVPILRKQSGFTDELTFLSSTGNQAIAISLWDDKASADAYDRDGYPQVLRSLSNVLEGTPVVTTYDVCTSTCHKIPVHN